MDRCALPPALPVLVESYAGRQPEAVRYRAPSWDSALAGVPGRPTRLLVDPTLAAAAAAAQPRYRAVGDRLVTAEAVAEDKLVLISLLQRCLDGDGSRDDDEAAQ